MAEPPAPGPLVAGPAVDGQTRCVHWATPRDVVAFRLPCCAPFWPCSECHEETADHPARPWPVDQRSEAAVLCGVCRSVLTIAEYLAAEAVDPPACPRCAAPFNPGCRTHLHLYFAPT